MKIDGVEILRLSEWDGLPIKNHLPVTLKDRMKTENQWLESGYVVKGTATAYKMHPSAMAKRTFVYYLDEDVEPVTAEDAPKNCMTCSIRNGRFCVVAGDFVSSKNSCSEWSSAPLDFSENSV